MELGAVIGLMVWIVLGVGALLITVKTLRDPYVAPLNVHRVRIADGHVKPVACVHEDTAVYPSEAPTDPRWPFRGDSL